MWFYFACRTASSSVCLSRREVEIRVSWVMTAARAGIVCPCTGSERLCAPGCHPGQGGTPCRCLSDFIAYRPLVKEQMSLSLWGCNELPVSVPFISGLGGKRDFWAPAQDGFIRPVQWGGRGRACVAASRTEINGSMETECTFSLCWPGVILLQDDKEVLWGLGVHSPPNRSRSAPIAQMEA